jgi:hypothetical protein
MRNKVEAITESFKQSPVSDDINDDDDDDDKASKGYSNQLSTL